LNTSFNENEPVVCTPRHAIDCFLKTRMDVIYLGNHAVRRKANGRERGPEGKQASGDAAPRLNRPERIK
jgi:carbamoyltransferase